MKILSIISATRDEVKLNPYVGSWAWLLHRLSGVGLLFYVIIHMWVLGSANTSPEAFNQRLGMVQTPLFHILEIGLIGIIFYHMFNGLAISIVDLFGITRKYKKYTVIGLCLFIIFTIYAAILIIPRVGAHS
jgi:succinate dehydrogenase / fumarate reductase, cytochrome b subunit